ncbi:MAG: choice-of-anchor tandem repeat GloVer-containing protein, partial [Aeromicrobium sp.]
VGPTGDVFGATSYSGEWNLGTVYKISGGQKTVLHSFAGTDGLFPEGAVTLTAEGRLFGTTPIGGPNYHEGHNVHGVVYRLQPNGNDFRVVHSFKGGYQDGARPVGRLLQASDGRIYGTTTGGGAAKNGVIFAVTPQ